MPIASNNRIFTNLISTVGQVTVDRIVAAINAGSPTLAAGLSALSTAGWALYL